MASIGQFLTIQQFVSASDIPDEPLFVEMKAKVKAVETLDSQLELNVEAIGIRNTRNTWNLIGNFTGTTNAGWIGWSILHVLGAFHPTTIHELGWTVCQIKVSGTYQQLRDEVLKVIGVSSLADLVLNYLPSFSNGEILATINGQKK